MLMNSKSLSGNTPEDIKEGFHKLLRMAEQEKADDKKGQLTGITQILLATTFATFMVWSVVISVYPPAILKVIQRINDAQNKSTAQTLDVNNFLDKKEKEKNIFNVLLEFVQLLLQAPFSATAVGAVGGGMGYYVHRRRKKARLNSDGKSAMDLAIEEEMRRLRSAIEGDSDSNSIDGLKNKVKADALDGATLVELFNNFADIMEIRGDLPRDKEETASEYFARLSAEISYPQERSKKAARYFENELYGRMQTSREDKKAFMELLLEMMSKSKRHPVTSF